MLLYVLDHGEKVGYTCGNNGAGIIMYSKKSKSGEKRPDDGDGDDDNTAATTTTTWRWRCMRLGPESLSPSSAESSSGGLRPQ